MIACVLAFVDSAILECVCVFVCFLACFCGFAFVAGILAC